MRLRLYLSGLIIILAMSGASFVALAQEAPIVIQRMEIALWPEYDDPRLLVIYRGEFAEQPTSPISFTIPSTAQVNAAAHLSDGRLIADEWTIFPANDVNFVSYKPGSSRFQFEYYDDAISISPRKSFTFRFQSEYDILALDIEIQQPLRASDLTSTLALSLIGRDEQGFRYFRSSVGPVSPGQMIEFTVYYAKEDNRPSRLKGSRTMRLLPWLIAGSSAAVILITGLIILVRWPRRQPLLQPQKPTLKQNRTRRAYSAEKQASSTADRAKFCVQCGRRFRSDERFCPQCGTTRD